MGNQGYSHDATRVACEIFWAGEIGEVREVHAWHGRAQLAAGDDEDSGADAGAGHARLGSVAGRRCVAPVHGRRSGVQGFRRGAQRAQSLAGRGAAPARSRRRCAARRSGHGAGAGGAGRGGGGLPGAENFGFYLPFNWRGFYDFGSSLIGDWGVHILGPANWALQLSPEVAHQRRVHQEEGLPPVHLSR